MAFVEDPLGYLGTPDASETVKGKVRIATTAETTAGSRSDLACSPAGVAAVAIAGAPDASTTTKGIIEIATNSEAAAKTSGTLALVPSNIPSIMSDPGAIGNTTAGSGAFTSLTASGAFSLTGDTVAVSEGGTGASSLTDHGILLGSGTAAVTVTAVGTNNQVLIGQSGADPIWTTNLDLPGTLDVTGAVVLDDALTVAGTLDVSGDATFDTNTLFVDVSGNNVGIGTATPAAADKLHVTDGTAGTAMIAEFEHSDNTNAASHSQILIQTGGASGGDPLLVLDVSATQQYYFGIDNTDSDILKIGSGTAVGTNSSLELTNAGALSVLRGDVTITRDAGAASSLGLNITNTNAADTDSNALLAITSGNAGSGDPQVNLIVTGGSTHHIGVDNSDSDTLKIGLGADVGTTDNLTITTGGAISAPRGDITITRDAGAASAVALNVTNTNAADLDSNAQVVITSGAAGSGDPQAQFVIDAVQTWTMGIDNSASDAFVISRGTALGTNNNISISTSDVTTINQLALTTDLAVADGGTGASTLTDNGVLFGNGTAAIGATAEPSDGQLIIGATGAAPAAATLGVSNGLTATAGANSLAIQITDWAQTTFTPALGTTGTDFDSITYTTQQGNHTRIGNLIIFNVYIQINAVTVGAATGDLTITGLPVVAAATPAELGLTCATNGIDLPGTPVGLFAKILATEQFARPFIVQDNGTATAITAAGVANGDEIWVQGMYMV